MNLVWFGLLAEFDLVWSIHRQTNKIKKLFNFFDLICECILIFCGQEKRKNKQTNQIYILIYKYLIILICGFVCTICGHKKI